MVMEISKISTNPSLKVTKREMNEKPFEVRSFRNRLSISPSILAMQLSFCDFMEKINTNDVIQFFRAVIEEVEAYRLLLHYRLRICEDDSIMTIHIDHGMKTDGPKMVSPEECISCNEDTELFPGMLSGKTILKEYSDSKFVNCSLDAQGRAMFVITPRRHVERLSELTDDELYSFWKSAASVIQIERVKYLVMILNHGDYRNLPHLHLKIKLEERSYQSAMQRWDKDRQDVWRRLRDEAPKKEKPCRYFLNGSCFAGNTCRFLHTTD